MCTNGVRLSPLLQPRDIGEGRQRRIVLPVGRIAPHAEGVVAHLLINTAGFVGDDAHAPQVIGGDVARGQNPVVADGAHRHDPQVALTSIVL